MPRILIIDDEANIRMMLRLALEHVGHTVEVAADGPEGLEKFGDGRTWDAVILDQRMPGMEGLEVLRQMRRSDPATRVLMITAFGTIDLADEALGAGATDFLRKPFTVEMLRGAVEAALTGLPQPAEAGTYKGSPLLRFVFKNVNGFRFEPADDVPPAEHAAGERRYCFTVRVPAGTRQACIVVLPPYLISAVTSMTQRATWAAIDEEAFWQALAAEALANHLWQNAETPPGGLLRVDDLTTGLRKWIDVAGDGGG